MFWRCGEVKKACGHVQKTDIVRQISTERDSIGYDDVFSFQKYLTEEQKELLSLQFGNLEDELGCGCRKLKDHFLSAMSRRRHLDKGVVHLEPAAILNWVNKNAPVLQSGANMTCSKHISQKRKQSFACRGYELYSQGKVAIVLLAGDFNASHEVLGMADIGLLSKKTVFQLYAERILRLQHLVQRRWKMHAVRIPVYIMCNAVNQEEIEFFFREHSFFGLLERDVLFCTQLQYPAVDADGRMILSNEHTILELPAGNSVFFSLREAGLVSDMKTRGIRYLYVSSTDNLLAKIGDPLFIGHCEAMQIRSGVKCISRDPTERELGIFCNARIANNDDAKEKGSKLRASVFYPSDISNEVREEIDQGDVGTLAYADLQQYFFTLEFVSHVASSLRVPLHVVDHQVALPNLNADKSSQSSSQRSSLTDCPCFRFEFRVADAFEFAGRTLGFEVCRSENAIVQQHFGKITAAKALKSLSICHQQWMLAAGASFTMNQIAAEQEETKCEISPLVSYDGEDLEGVFVKALQLPYYMTSPFEKKAAALLSNSAQQALPRHNVAEKCHTTTISGQENRSRRSQSTKKADYFGERASPFEVLPPTPCNAGFRVRLDDYDSSDKTSITTDEVEDDNGDTIHTDVMQMKRKSKPRRRKSILGQDHTQHHYGGSFLRNTGRFGNGAHKSLAYWAGPPNNNDSDEDIPVVHHFGGA